MASVSIVKTTIVGDERVVFANVTMSSSYTTNGESVTPSQVGLTYFDNVSTDAASASGVLLAYDYTNQKFKAFNGTTEITATTNLSTTVARVEFWGK